MKRIVFLASGDGGTMRFIHHALRALRADAGIAAVIADRDCGALASGRSLGIRAESVEYSRGAPDSLRQALLNGKPDIIVTNVHKILDAETLSLFPDAFINLHYSLLPAFSGMIGMKTLEEARNLNAGFVGATCHMVNERVDAGRILVQCCFAVDWVRDSMPVLINELFRGACLCLLQAILGRLGESTAPVNTATVTFQKALHFSPQLQFDCDFCTEAFWRLVAGNK